MNTPVIDEVDGTPQDGGVTDPWDTSMPEGPTLKDQHRVRAQLVRDGERALAFHAITDYRSAKPTFKKKRKSRAKAKAKPSVDLFDLLVVPEKSKTRADLLTRLNARLRGKL